MGPVDYAILEAPSVLGLFPRGVEAPSGGAPRCPARRPDRRAARRPRDASALRSAARSDHRFAQSDGPARLRVAARRRDRRGPRRGRLPARARWRLLDPPRHDAGPAAARPLTVCCSSTATPTSTNPRPSRTGRPRRWISRWSTGRGPSVVTDLEGRRPLVRDEDVVQFARRDAEEAAEAGSQRIEDTRIEVIDLGDVRQRGVERAAGDALERLVRPEIDGFWVHLDCDALDDAVMPAVDYRLPGGLRWDELETRDPARHRQRQRRGTRGHHLQSPARPRPVDRATPRRLPRPRPRPASVDAEGLKPSWTVSVGSARFRSSWWCTTSEHPKGSTHEVHAVRLHRHRT